MLNNKFSSIILVQPVTMPKLRAGKIKCSIVSVTSILSRLTECFIVSRYLFPTVPENDLASQFAYRPPGNTTAALIYLNHHVSKLLENNNYVWCHMTGFRCHGGDLFLSVFIVFIDVHQCFYPVLTFSNSDSVFLYFEPSRNN